MTGTLPTDLLIDGRLRAGRDESTAVTNPLKERGVYVAELKALACRLPAQAGAAL